MTTEMLISVIAASSALVGALICGLATGLAAYFETKAESRRQLVRLAAEIELEQVKALVTGASPGSDLHIGDSSPAIVSHYKLLVALHEEGPESKRVRDLLAAGVSGTGRVVSIETEAT